MAAADDDSFHLPSDPWLQILSFLDYDDLIRCSEVNRQLHELSHHSSHWRKLCRKYWLVSSCPENTTWKECFKFWYNDYGRYVRCYAKIKTAWNQISEFMKTNCEVIYKSIKDGIDEETLNELETRLGLSFPNDLRCSYRIHNGQQLTCPGVLGSIEAPNHYRSECLLDLETAVESYNQTGRSYLPLTFCTNTQVSQYINLSDGNGFPMWNIFYMTRHGYYLNEISVFIAAGGFEEWITDYASKLSTNQFPVITDQPFRFEHDPDCVCTTDHITVSVSTSFVPELSMINPTQFFHAYRITMCMSKDAPSDESCQLETRHWRIVDQEGYEETVDGAGVVGEFPIMKPGASFSWISCTTFVTPRGSIQGHFDMRNLKNGGSVKIECPRFDFNSLPFVKTRLR